MALLTFCIGSMLYYSPEIITGQKYVGPEVDCWCLGILLYRMTVGSETFGHARSKFIASVHVFHCLFMDI